MAYDWLRATLCMAIMACVGCVSRARPVEDLPLLTTHADLLGTQMLHPGVEERRCAWRLLWQEGGGPARSALDAVARRDPAADVVLDASLTTRTIAVAVLVRECATVRGSLARQIRTIELPLVGGGGGAHHGHHGP